MHDHVGVRGHALARGWVGWLVPSALGVILLAALALRVVGIAYDYPFMLELDENNLVYATINMMAAHSLDPHFYVYGPLLDYIEAAWLLPYIAVRELLHLQGLPTITLYWSWTGATTDPLMHVYGRLPFVLLGVGAVWLCFLVGRRLGGPWTGLLGAAFFALSPLHIYQSHFMLPNAPTSFFTLLTVWWALRYLQSPVAQEGRVEVGRVVGDSGTGLMRRSRDLLARLLGGESRDLVLAMVAAALGASIKYNAVVVLVAPLAAVYLTRRDYAESWLRRCLRLCVVALVVFLVVTPPAIFNTIAFVHGAAYQVKVYDIYGGGAPEPSVIWNTQYLIQHEGLLLFPAALVGLAALAWRERRRSDLLVLLTIVIYYLFLDVQKAHFDRNLLVTLPLVSIAGAYALVRLARLWRPLGLAAASLAALVVLSSLGQGAAAQERAVFMAPPAQLIVRSWLQAHLPSHARLMADLYTVPPLDRSDVVMTYTEGLTFTPQQFVQMGVDYVVISKTLPYYLDPRHRITPDVILAPLYQDGGVVVYKVVRLTH